MTMPPVFSRRWLLIALGLAASSSASAQVRRGSDQGIGGTGVTRGHDQGIGGTGITSGHDQGIGGTGIVGVIERFGSIFVNGERIGYAANVPVRIDGEPASAKALKIGHLARVLALPQANRSLITHRINVVSEVIGPIETVNDGEMTVLGQRIIAAGHESWRRPGTTVAVFGLRRIDGVIVASLVEPRGDAAARVSGPLERDRGGLRIGGLRIGGVDAALVGRRVQAEGRVTEGVMQVSHIRADVFSDLSGASRLSIAGYVRRVGGNLHFGSGYVAHDGGRFESSGDAPVVVNAVLDGSRGLRVESIRSLKAGATPGPGSNPGVPSSAPATPGGRPDAPRGLGQGPGSPGGVGGLGHSGGGGSGQGGGVGHSSGGGNFGGGGGVGGSGASHGGGRH